MPVKDGREYRDIEAVFEARDNYAVEGYATTFGQPYPMGRGMSEVIERSAFDGCDMSDVIFQYDHAGMVMARNRNGTLRVEPDDHGLRVWADLSGSEQGRQLHEAIRNGLVDRMSWGFLVADDGWEYDRDTRTSHVAKVEKVFDVSAVSIPANDGTEIQARSYLDGVIEAEQRESLQRGKEADERARLAIGMSITKERLNGIRAL